MKIYTFSFQTAESTLLISSKINTTYICICSIYILCVCVYMYGGLFAKSCPTLVTQWTVAWQAPLSMGFSRQGYWSGLPFPSPGYLLHPVMKPRSPALQTDSLPIELRRTVTIASITGSFQVQRLTCLLAEI